MEFGVRLGLAMPVKLQVNSSAGRRNLILKSSAARNLGILAAVILFHCRCKFDDLPSQLGGRRLAHARQFPRM